MSLCLDLGGGTTNFAGSFGDHLLQIRDGLITGMSIRHEHSAFMFGKVPQELFIPSITTVDISLTLKDNGLILTNMGENCMNLVRNKFVCDCTIEELLVAIQTKLTGI